MVGPKIHHPRFLRPFLDRPLVMTNGCFDILHRGHVAYLEQAAKLGQCLLVAVNTDESVKRQGKGQDRPINPLQDRLTMLAALGCVDIVTWFDADTPLELIRKLKPDVLVKGGDWSEDQIAGAKEVKEWGGRVAIVPHLHQRSTTALIERIRSMA
jgi:D-glycero-beta-D-manno-heptose 1-phosphate adenylyltransferase